MPGTRCPPARSISVLHRRRDFRMDPQDQELLDKQLRYLHVAPRRNGVVIATIVAVFLGGIIIGVTETLVSGYISSTYRDAIAFGILILILLVKPSGLLGKKEIEKV